MRCHPSRWLWGLLPLAVWAWVTVLSERPRIEADLSKRAGEALKAAGLDWATVSFNGRDGVITGQASDDDEPTAALRLVNSDVWGVRIADTQAELLEKVDTYVWSATLQDNDSLRLTGYVPNEAARRAILAAAKADFPRLQIDDRTKLARGAPEQAVWIDGLKFALKQLTGLKKGHVAVAGIDLSVAGQAQTIQSYDSIKSALNSRLPKKWKLAADKVTPPLVSPYQWSAQRSGDQVTLSGYVPDERTRATVLEHANKAFGKVVDRMHLADGAPEALRRGVVTALDQVSKLKNGSAQLKGEAFALAGEAADEDSAKSVRNAWRAGLGGAFTVADNVTYDNSAQLAAEAKRRAEEAQAAEARRREQEAEARRDVEAQRAAEAAEAKRRAEETQAAEARRREQEAEARRDAEAQRAAEAAEAKRRAEEAEAKRVADAAEAKRRAEESETKRVAAVAEQRKAEASRCEQALRSVALEGVIRFERASADLHSDSRLTLERLAKAANACPAYKIEIEGHTDAEGTPERNKKLSERRAQSIVSYLTQHGVEAARLDAVGYGETRPVAPNDSAENRAKNRRIEFTVKAN